MAMKIEHTVIWIAATFSVVAGYQRFEGPFLKMEAALSTETVVYNYHTTRCNNPENRE